MPRWPFPGYENPDLLCLFLNQTLPTLLPSFPVDLFPIIQNYVNYKMMILGDLLHQLVCAPKTHPMYMTMEEEKMPIRHVVMSSNALGFVCDRDWPYSKLKFAGRWMSLFPNHLGNFAPLVRHTSPHATVVFWRDGGHELYDLYLIDHVEITATEIHLRGVKLHSFARC